MGHLGIPHIVSQKLIYIRSGQHTELPSLTSRLPNYKKIDQKRPYIVSAMKCLGESSVLFMLWGGGNCDDGCEAYAKVDFNDKGEISSISGLTYKEYNYLEKSN